jgi:hypothetical protein
VSATDGAPWTGFRKHLVKQRGGARLPKGRRCPNGPGEEHEGTSKCELNKLIQRKRNRAKSGDVIEMIGESGSRLYVQFVGMAGVRPIVRVLPGLYPRRLDNDELPNLVVLDELHVLPSFIPAGPKNADALIVGEFPIPEGNLETPPLRAPAPDRWQIIDADGIYLTRQEFGPLHPDIDQKQLAWSVIPSAALLRKMMETGWGPREATSGSNCLPFNPEPTM